MRTDLTAVTGCAGRGRCASGQVMLITVLAIVLLASVVFLLMNAGDQMNRRTAAQNAADSAAMSGATYMARSMNAVAMNNVGMSRMLSLVPVIDSLPVAFAMSEDLLEIRWEMGEEQGWWLASLPDDALSEWMKQPGKTLRQYQIRLGDEREILQPFLDRFCPDDHGRITYDLREYTYYELPGMSGPAPHGAFWVAASHLHAFNRATVDTAGAAAQQNAAHYGALSLTTGAAAAEPADGAFMVPVLPHLPAIEGRWRDWYRDPRTRDTFLVDGWIPDLGFAPRRPEQYTPKQLEALMRHRGPTTALFGWEDEWRAPTPEEGLWLSLGFRSSRSGEASRRPVGPFLWMLRQIESYYEQHLPHGMVRTWYSDGGGGFWFRGGTYGPGSAVGAFRLLSVTKLDYMFGRQLDRRIHIPDWEIDYPRLRALPDAQRRQVYQTLHDRIVVVSEVDHRDPRVAEQALIELIPAGAASSGVLSPLWQRGWHDRAEEGIGISCPPSAVRVPRAVRVETTVMQPMVQSTAQLSVHLQARPDEIAKLADHVWQAEFSPREIRRAFENRLEAARRDLLRRDPDATMEWDPLHDDDFAWVIVRDFFVAADVGTDEEPIRNPANFPADADLPVPQLLDPVTGDYETAGLGIVDYRRITTDQFNIHHDMGVRRETFTFLGVARRSSRATVATAWRDRFRGGSPVGAVLATAQVELYNPTSWDLWTQDWRAQLVPVTDLGDWAARMEQGADDAQATGGAVSEASVRELAEFFRVLDPQLADLLTNH